MQPPPLPPQPPPLPSQAVRNTFSQIDTKTLKRLVSDYHSTQALGILWILGSFFCIIIALIGFVTHSNDTRMAIRIGVSIFFILFGVFALISAIGTLKRTSWGRIPGIIHCSLNLAGFPIGTLIGILGLIAFIRSPELFGHQRLDADEIKLELKYRNKNELA